MQKSITVSYYGYPCDKFNIENCSKVRKHLEAGWRIVKDEALEAKIELHKNCKQKFINDRLVVLAK